MGQRGKPSGRWRRHFFIIGLYLLLLGLSQWVRTTTDTQRPPLPGQVQTTLEVGPSMREEVVAFRDLGPRDAPVLVLIHGSPLASRAFDELIPHLVENYRLIIPDLPGFGASSFAIADYSTRHHARAVGALLDELGLPSAHFVGYSQGGGVLLDLHNQEPWRIQSLTLLSSIGVQELELLGDYTLNHGLYAVQLGILWTAQNLVPHFGLFDRFLLNVPYARNFYDTDQRPFREYLLAYDGPMLIIHGDEDPLVPVAAAEEHARLVPQAQKRVLDGGHLLVFQQPERVAGLLDTFIEGVEAGSAGRREGQKVAREMPHREVEGRAAAFFFFILTVGTLVSEDLACIAAGLMASRGVIDFWLATFACMAGIFIGDLGLYLIGRLFGMRAVSVPPLRWFLRPRDVERMGAWFRRRGIVIILSARFIPGTRLPTYFAAGVARVPILQFAFVFAVGAVLWTPLLVGLAYWLGDAFLRFFERYDKFAVVGLITTLFLLWLLIHLIVPLFTHRGRRLLKGRWMRQRRWEFWSPWRVYPPVVLYVLWLGVRHRCLQLFTCTNPAMPEGGFNEEPKAEILTALAHAGDAIPPWCLLEGDGSARVAPLRRFLAGRQKVAPAETRLNPDEPVVLKPNAGQRGQGVAIVKDWPHAEAYLRDCPVPVLAQTFAPGREYGVFYYRMPDAERGDILGITEKILPAVTGDGERTLEELILDDNRAVGMAKFYLTTLEDRISEMPPPGERVKLTELGTHCRGAIFRDGSHLITDSLRDWLDTISKPYQGFYFGRYDIIAASDNHLKRADGLKILELNGVSSEATWIYDPRYKYRDGLRTLCWQWRIAFAIARANRARGCQPAPVRRVLWLILREWEREHWEAPRSGRKLACSRAHAHG